MEAEELRKYALTLSEKERAELASGLIDSLDLIVDADAQVAWQEEIARRLEQGETSQVETNPWDEVRYLSRCPSYILRQFPVRTSSTSLRRRGFRPSSGRGPAIGESG